MTEQGDAHDGSVEDAIPPIKALLHIMVHGHYEGKDLGSEEIRDLFRKETILTSDWYLKRLENKQKTDIRLIDKMISNLEEFISNPINESVIKEFRYDERLEKAKEIKAYYESEAYLESLQGTIGAADIAL